MPSERAFFRASRAGPALAWIGRLAGAMLITGIGLFALVLLAVRFVVFPQVESYRESLATAVSAELGRPVEIAVLATGWDGWNPKFVIEGFRVLDRERTGAVPLIELPVVELVVAWTSLPLHGAPIEGARDRATTPGHPARSRGDAPHRGDRNRPGPGTRRSVRSPNGYCANRRSSSVMH